MWGREIQDGLADIFYEGNPGTMCLSGRIACSRRTDVKKAVGSRADNSEYMSKVVKSRFLMIVCIQQHSTNVTTSSFTDSVPRIREACILCTCCILIVFAHIIVWSS